MTDTPNPEPTFATRAELEAWARRLVWATGDKHPSFTGDTIVRVTLAHLHLGQAPTTQADGGGA